MYGKSNISMLGKLQEKELPSSIDFVFRKHNVVLHSIGFANQAGHLVLETS